MLEFNINQLKLDSANRFHLPSKNQLVDKEVVVGRLQDSILIFEVEEFKVFIEQIDGFPATAPLIVRRARRNFYSRCFQEKVDQKGRLTINRKLMKGGI